MTDAAFLPRLGARVVALSGAGLFGGLLVAAAFGDHFSVPALLWLWGFAVLAAVRPPIALAGLALLLPVATWIGRLWNGAVAWPETIAVAFAAGYCARAVHRGWGTRQALNVPILVFIATVAASLAVKVALLYATIGGDSLIREFLPSMSWDYFAASGGFRELDAAMRLIEGMVLLHATAACVAAQPAIASRLVALVVAGGAVASAMNLWRIWIGAQRADSPFDAFVQYLFTLRFNTHYGDVNAAGSHFVMILIPAVALCTVSLRWIPAAVLILTSVVLSGSRSALIAGLVAAAIWTLRRFVPAGRPSAALRRTAAILAVAGLCAAAALGYVAARRNLTPSSTALQYRLEFVKTTFRMLGDYPFFGVGVGQYPERTGDYSSPLLLQTYGAWNENAHNNFLQVLGELGVLGAAAFLLVLGTAARSWINAPQSESARVIEGAAAGALAFIITWFSGHPLLLDAPALSFWFLLGLTVRVPTSPVPATSRPNAARFALAALLLLSISVPLRARQQIANADLEHRGIGLSTWRVDGEGRRYRVAGPSSVIFVPSQARGLIVPLRAVAGEPVVSILWNGRAADRVRVPADRWLDLQMAVPADGSSPRFSRLGLQVDGAADSETPVLMIGKIEPQ